MSEQTPLKLVDATEVEGRNAADNGNQGGKDARSLSSLDKIDLGLVILVLLLVPLGAGNFATPHFGNTPPEDALGYLQLVGVPLVGLLAGLALLVAVWREWQRPVAIGPVSGLAGGALLMGLWAGLSMLFNQPISHLALNGWTTLMAVLIVGGLISRLGRDRQALIALLLVVAGAGSLAAAFGVREYLVYWKQGDYAHRVFGTFANPNFLAGYVQLTLPLTLACFVSARERLPRLLLGIGIALQSMCLLLTGSRAGVGMLLVVLLIWVALLARAGVLRQHARGLAMGLGLVALAGLLASTPLMLRVVSSRSHPNAGSSSSVAQAGGAGETATADSQGHSAKFRQYTWIGTLHMIGANPLVGSGIGNYETAYERHAITAFTAHAHNSFLQWTAETGLPGALCLLVVLASSTAFATYVLFLRMRHEHTGRQTERAKTDSRDGSGNDDDDDDAIPVAPLPLPHGFEEPRILLAGLLAAVVSTALHSLFDSDWYIVATAVTLSAMIGLLAALARDIAPLATQTPRPLSRAMLGGCIALALVLLWRDGTTYLARVAQVQALNANVEFREQMAQGNNKQASDTLQSAIESYKSVASLDPFNPEPLLTLSSLYQTVGNFDLALQAQEKATRIAPIGKTFYQLGQYHRRQAFKSATSGSAGNATPGAPLADNAPIALAGTTASPASLDQAELKRALDAFQRTRDLDPHSLQCLRQLAETQALLGNTSEAIQLYRDITGLEETPLGTVRAIPEIIEPDFAFAHARLATYLTNTPTTQDGKASTPANLSANLSTDLDEALAEYAKADNLLKTYWTNRKYELYQIMPPERLRAMTLLYAAVLEGWQKALKAKGGTAAGELPAVQAEQAKFLQERQADAEAEAKVRGS